MSSDSNSKALKPLSYDAEAAHLSFGERVHLYSVLLGAVPTAFYNAIKKLFRGPSGLHPYSSAVIMSTFQYLMQSLPPKQIWSGLGFAASWDLYVQWCRDEGKCPVRVTDIEEEGVKSRLMWIGEEPWVGSGKAARGKKVLLFTHGGGFVLPMSIGHIREFAWLKNEASKQGIEFSVAMLEYGVAPNTKYPNQHIQAALALKHLLERGVSPSDMLIAGDSAGGNVALSLISHLLHPHPSIPSIPRPKTPFAGLLLAAPWISFAHNTSSFRNNAHKDFLNERILTSWSQHCVSGTSFASDLQNGQFLAQAGLTTEDYWRGISELTPLIGITLGEKEVFADDIAGFMGLMQRVAENEKKEGRSVEVATCAAKEEVHDAGCMVFVFDPEFKRGVPESLGMLLEWTVRAFRK